MAEVLLNNPQGLQLTALIGPGDGTVHLSQAVGSVGQTFRLQFGGPGGEIALVTGGAGTNTLSVTRGQEGTTPTGYGIGTSVAVAASAGAFNAVIAEAIPSSLPPSGAAGGSLAGTYPNPSLAAGIALNLLTDPGANKLIGDVGGSVGPISIGSNLVLFGGTLSANPPPVTSVFGRIGAVVPVFSDYPPAFIGAYPNTYALNNIAAASPTVTDWSNNGHKITNIANGTASSDAAAFGQIPTSLPISNAFTPRAVQIGGNITTAVVAAFTEIAAATGGPGTGGLDVTIAAVTNDVIEISGHVNFVSSNPTQVNVDLATMVAGSPVNWIGQSGGASGKTGLLFAQDPDAQISLSFSILYTVQAGDISGGNVVLRPFYFDASGSNILGRSTTNGPMYFGVKNLKH